MFDDFVIGFSYEEYEDRYFEWCKLMEEIYGEEEN